MVGVNYAMAEDLTFDLISQTVADELTVNISDELEPGDYQMNVEVTNADGTSDFRNYFYCKDNDGKINWNTWCSKITPMINPAQLENIELQTDLPAYDPESDVKTVQNIVISVAAIIGYISFGLGSSLNLNGNSSGGLRPELAEENARILERSKKRRRRGDRLPMWKKSFFTLSDAFFVRCTEKVANYSPLITRSISDASYLRALLGSLSLLTYPLGVLLGFLALQSTSFQALPPAVGILISIVLLGIFDSLAGFIAGIVFFAGCVITGHVTTFNELLISIGLLALAFSPILLSSLLRPIRRHVSNGDELWERITDLFLGTVLTVWVVSQMIDLLPGLAGFQLFVVSKWAIICTFAAIAVLLRRLLEDLALNEYPERLEKVEFIHIQPTTGQSIAKGLIQIVIFSVLAEPFIDTSWKFWLGVFLFALPKLLSLFSSSFPKAHLLFRVVPNAAIKILVLLTLGAGITYFYLENISDASSRLSTSFFLLMLPGALISILSLFSKKKETADDWKRNGSGQVLYRVAGTLVFVLLTLNTMKLDIFSKFFGLFS
jgi:hypothetical protein